jgi:hypothetical protein
LLVTLAVGYFLIMPAVSEYNTVKAELDATTVMYDEANEKKSQVQQLRLDVANARQAISETTARIQGNNDRFRSLTETEVLEGEFTGVMLENDIVPSTFELSSDNLRQLGGQQAESDLVKFLINISGTGTLVNLMSLPDYVNDIFSFRLTEMSIVGDGGDGEAADNTIYRADYTLEALLKAWE